MDSTCFWIEQVPLFFVDNRIPRVPGKLRQMPIYYPTNRPDYTVMKAFFAEMDWLLSVGFDVAMGVCSLLC